MISFRIRSTLFVSTTNRVFATNSFLQLFCCVQIDKSWTATTRVQLERWLTCYVHYFHCTYAAYSPRKRFFFMRVRSAICLFSFNFFFKFPPFELAFQHLYIIVRYNRIVCKRRTPGPYTVSSVTSEYQHVPDDAVLRWMTSPHIP